MGSKINNPLIKELKEVSEKNLSMNVEILIRDAFRSTASSARRRLSNRVARNDFHQV